MRMNQDDKLTAEDVVNNYSMYELIDIFYAYGEEKLSKMESINKSFFEKNKRLT